MLSVLWRLRDADVTASEGATLARWSLERAEDHRCGSNRPGPDSPRGPGTVLARQTPQAFQIQHPDAPAGQIHHAGIRGGPQGAVDSRSGATGHGRDLVLG
jgi:hypothetical protein